MSTATKDPALVAGLGAVQAEQRRIQAETVARQKVEKAAQQEQAAEADRVVVNAKAFGALAAGIRSFRGGNRTAYAELMKRKTAALREFLAADTEEIELFRSAQAQVGTTRKALADLQLPPQWRHISGGSRVERRSMQLGSGTWEGDVSVSEPVHRVKLDSPDLAYLREFLSEGGTGIPSPATSPFHCHIPRYRVEAWLKAARSAGYLND
jgi:hypothetical protein